MEGLEIAGASESASEPSNSIGNHAEQQPATRWIDRGDTMWVKSALPPNQGIIQPRSITFRGLAEAPGNKETMKRSRLNKIGKITRRWIETRKLWFSLNPADYYYCYMCGRQLLKEEVELDHVRSRSRYPELRFELSNIKPSCHDCNMKKGSRDIDEI